MSDRVGVMSPWPPAAGGGAAATSTTTRSTASSRAFVGENNIFAGKHRANQSGNAVAGFETRQHGTFKATARPQCRQRLQAPSFMWRPEHTRLVHGAGQWPRIRHSPSTVADVVIRGCNFISHLRRRLTSGGRILVGRDRATTASATVPAPGAKMHIELRRRERAIDPGGRSRLQHTVPDGMNDLAGGATASSLTVIFLRAHRLLAAGPRGAARTFISSSNSFRPISAGQSRSAAPKDFYSLQQLPHLLCQSPIHRSTVFGIPVTIVYPPARVPGYGVLLGDRDGDLPCARLSGSRYYLAKVAQARNVAADAVPAAVDPALGQSEVLRAFAWYHHPGA